jgi:hypothetical protein
MSLSAQAQFDCNIERLNEIGKKIIAVDQTNRVKYLAMLRDTTLPDDDRKHAIAKLIEDGLADDKQNIETITPIIANCGLPKGAMNKNPIVDGIFYVVLHAPLEICLKYYPLFKAANLRGDIPDDRITLLEKRIHDWQAIRKRNEENKQP